MTKKTVANHGISVLVQKDSAVLRALLDDRDFCRNYDDTAIMVAGGGAGFVLIDDGDDGADRDQLGAPTDNQDTVDFDAASGTSAGLWPPMVPPRPTPGRSSTTAFN